MKKAASRLIVITLGFVAAFLLLEAGFQAGHALSVWRKKSAAKKQLEQQNTSGKKKLTLMCIGESMTACPPEFAYTTFLQKNLDEKYPDIDIDIVNRGTPRSTSAITLEELGANLETVQPNVVVAMIGINDIQTLFTQQHIESRIKPSFWNNFRSIYFIKYLLFELKRKSSKMVVPVDFNEQMDYYFDTGKHNFFWNLADHDMLDRIMLKEAKTDFAKAFWKAKCTLNDDNPKQAFKLFSEVVKMNPKRPEPYVFLSIANHQTNYEYNPELEQLCRKYSKNKSDFLFMWGLFHQHHRVFKQARKVFTEGTKMPEPEATRFTIMLADLNRYTDKRRMAQRLLKPILAKDPQNKAALYTMGLVYCDIANSEQAAKYFEPLTEIDPTYTYAQFALGEAYIQMHKQNPADKTLLKKAKNAFETVARGGGQQLASVYVKLGDNKKINEENRRFTQNYRRIFEELDQRNIKLIAMQYPQRNVENLKQLFAASERKKILFVDNEPTFKHLLENHNYNEVFLDDFAGNMGHYTALGGRAIAQNVQKAVEHYMSKQK